MEFARRNWNANKGKGVVKFYDKAGKLIPWEYGKKLNINEIKFNYKGGKKHNFVELKKPFNKKITIGQKFFPEVVNNQIAINQLKSTLVDDPFRPGKKIEFGKLVQKINVKVHGWSPHSLRMFDSA